MICYVFFRFNLKFIQSKETPNLIILFLNLEILGESQWQLNTNGLLQD